MQLGVFPKPSDGSVVWAVDSNHPFVDACTWMDQLSGEATERVDSLGSLVRACQRFVVGGDKPIDFLAVFGHGTAGYQAVGAGKRELDDTGNRSLWYLPIVRSGGSHLQGRAASRIEALNGVLSSDATVLLAGCSVAKGDEGEGLLTTVSSLLRGRRVMGFANDVYWWWGAMSGWLRTATGATVTGEWASLRLGG